MLPLQEQNWQGPGVMGNFGTLDLVRPPRDLELVLG